MKGKIMHLLATVIIVVLCSSCDNGELKLDQKTAKLNFESSYLEIPQDYIEMHPLVIKANVNSVLGLSSYFVYVTVDDPNQYIGSVCTIGNPVYKTPDHEAGDHIYIYKATMAEGMLQTAITLTAGPHSEEAMDRTLTFAIIEDPLRDAYPNGNLYYSVGENNTLTLVLKDLAPEN